MISTCINYHSKYRVLLYKSRAWVVSSVVVALFH